MDLLQEYKNWVSHTKGDAELAAELASIADDAAAIEDRFYRDLEFGTGGLRGVLGAGTNRMNVYTVAKASQGCAAYWRAHFSEPSVAIAYDSRIGSEQFARTAAEVFWANGVRVHIYPRLMPTPSLSFAVRDLGCCGGIVITASHNPAKYNGYKVYGPDGCQITTEAAGEIQRCIDAVRPFGDVRRVPFEEGLRAGGIARIGEDTVERYLNAVQGTSVLPRSVPRDISIVYTPLNGTGISCVPRCLRAQGFTDISIPPQQERPDGHFPTCPYPNPEIPEALSVAVALAKERGSELVLATDPDCDRVGAAVTANGETVLISGNEMGALLFDFICRMRREAGTMPARPVAVKTIVTTPLAAKIAREYGVELIDVLTGFKFIGEQIGLLERAGEEDRYIFGFEESYGYLSGTFVRDKDAVNASLLVCELFAWYRSRGLTLLDGLRQLQEKHGYYSSSLHTFAFEGSAGFARMQALMNALRAEPPRAVAGLAVLSVTDYRASRTVFADGREEPVSLPVSDVLRYCLAGGAEAVVRPSGTEPKLKLYVTGTGEDEAPARAAAGAIAAEFTARCGA